MFNRRNFLKRSTLTAGAVVTGVTLELLAAHSALAQSNAKSGRRRARKPNTHGDYGPLQPVADQTGARILALPEGFEYVSFSKTGDRMSDGFATPAIHDGMAAFAAPDGNVRLIRNHELRNPAGNFTFGVTGPVSTRYDHLASGGCVTVDYDPRRKRIVRDFVSLNGTLVNCSGGLAFRDAGWISCEESIVGPAHGFARKHGYAFLVPSSASGPLPAKPITAMGRFTHEAAVADARTGIVYQTEDSGDTSGFYRFLPDSPDNLLGGGVLQMAKVLDVANYDTRSGQKRNSRLAIAWVGIDQPDPDPDSSRSSCFAQGFVKGGARFNRLEGIIRGEDGSVYFVSTSGGDARCGQIWRYQENDGGLLDLVFESPGSSVLDSPDNLCVTPSGAILLCEDDATNDGDTHPLASGITEVNRLVSLNLDGEPFTFAVNIFSDSEFAGACFSPDGEILFLNIQGSSAAGTGMTLAITGPWARGPL